MQVSESLRVRLPWLRFILYDRGVAKLFRIMTGILSLILKKDRKKINRQTICF
jgi:hypothetical protein